MTLYIFLAFLIAFCVFEAWALVKTGTRAARKEKEQSQKIQELNDAIKGLNFQVITYMQGKREYEELLRKSANNDDAGFAASVELMQQLSDSGKKRNSATKN